MLRHKIAKSQAPASRGETVLDMIKKKQKILDNPVNQKRSSVASAGQKEYTLPQNQYFDQTFTCPEQLKHFSQTLQEGQLTSDVSSFDGGLSSIQKS